MRRLFDFAFFAVTVGLSCNGNPPPDKPTILTAQTVPCEAGAIADPQPPKTEPLTPEEIPLVKAFELAARGEPVATNGDLMDTRNRQQKALEWLGMLYFEKRNYKKAREYFVSWEPWGGGCHLCELGGRAQRDHYILRCRLHLGEQAAVAGELRNGIKSGSIIERGMLHSHRIERAVILFRLYHEAGQTNDLVNFIKNTDDAKNADAIKYLLQVQDMIANKDVAGLIVLCQELKDFRIEYDSHTGWKSRVAADALVELLAGDATPVLKALEKPANVSTWLMYVLGKTGSKEALKWLTACASNNVSYDQLSSVTYAIALQGESGKQALSNLAKFDNYIGRTAGERLNKFPQTQPLERPWPHPKKGSLPR